MAFPVQNMEGLARVPIMDELFHNESDDWLTVDREQIAHASHFFDSDTTITTGFNFRLDALLNGGIVFERAGKKLTREAQDWMCREFSSFLRQVVRSRWCYGFAPCIWKPHPRFGGRPIVLDITELTVRYRRSFLGDSHFRYFYQPRHDMVEQEVENVATFTWDAPDSSGNLRSLVPMLIPDHMHEQMLMSYSLIATKSRAIPVMITETEKDQYDKDNISAPLARTPAQLGLTKNKMVEPATNADISMTVHAIEHTERYVDRVQPTMTHAILSNMAAVTQVPYFSSAFRLDPGKRFVAAPLPESPPDLLAFRLAREARAFHLMGVPMAMISNQSTSASAHSNRGVRQSTGDGNSYIVFENAQQALKLELINVMKSMFYSIHLQNDLEEYVRETPAQEWSLKGALQATSINVEMPSIPDEDRLQDYYVKGFLKYDALVRYLGSKHGIADDNWNEKPALTIKESNGEFTDPKPPPAKKAKT